MADNVAYCIILGKYILDIYLKVLSDSPHSLLPWIDQSETMIKVCSKINLFLHHRDCTHGCTRKSTLTEQMFTIAALCYKINQRQKINRIGI